MSKLSLSAAAVLAASLTLCPASAQDLQRQRSDFQHLVRQSHGVTRADGQLLALGGGVEASFEAGRIVVTPLLGGAAPHNMPMTLEFEGILRGDVTVVEIAAGALPIERTNQVDYRHGQGIVERYVSRADGVKQSVLIPQPIPGSGDLIVRMNVSTDLHCASTGHARQLDFDAGELGGIHIGSVVGIDATGVRVEGYMRFDGEHLDLALPAAFVDHATYPIDVDPVLGGATGTGRSFSDNEIDIAYDVTNDLYGVVYQTEASATDRDIYVQIISGAGARVSGPITIASNGFLSEFPKIASCNLRDEFLVVWQDNGAGDFDVRCRSLDPAARTTSQVVDIAATLVDETSPDVGGDSTLTATTGQCICVWDEGTAIKSCVVQLTAANPPAVTNVATVLQGLPLDYPAITKDGGSDRRHFVAFNVNGVAVGVAALDSTGTVVGSPATVAGGTGSTVFERLDIDGNGRHFTVVVEELEPASTTEHDIRASHGAWNGNVQLIDSFVIEGDQGFDESRPCIALMNSKYAAAWIDANANSIDIEATNLEIDSAARCGNEVIVAGDVRFERVNPAIVSRLSGGDAGSESGLLANRSNDLSNGNAVLRSRIYTTFGGGPVTVLTGTGGCSGGATTGIGSPCALGNRNFTITLTGADPGASLALLGIDPRRLQPTPICGATCGAMIIPELTVQISPIGGAGEVQVPIPCEPSLDGFQLYAQWLVLGSPAAGTCSLVPGLRPSDAIQLTLGN